MHAVSAAADPLLCGYTSYNGYAGSRTVSGSLDPHARTSHRRWRPHAVQLLLGCVSRMRGMELVDGPTRLRCRCSTRHRGWRQRYSRRDQYDYTALVRHSASSRSWLVVCGMERGGELTACGGCFSGALLAGEPRRTGQLLGSRRGSVAGPPSLWFSTRARLNMHIAASDLSSAIPCLCAMREPHATTERCQRCRPILVLFIHSTKAANNDSDYCASR